MAASVVIVAVRYDMMAELTWFVLVFCIPRVLSYGSLPNKPTHWQGGLADLRIYPANIRTPLQIVNE